MERDWASTRKVFARRSRRVASHSRRAVDHTRLTPPTVSSTTTTTTIGGEDILYAMATLGFENYAETLKIHLAKLRQVRPSVLSFASCGLFQYCARLKW